MAFFNLSHAIILMIVLVKSAISDRDHTLRVAVFVQPPFVERYRERDGLFRYRGYCIDLLDQVKMIAGFSYDLYEPEDQKCGIINGRGEWNGVIHELVTGNADIGLGPLTVTPERENVVDFTIPIYDTVGYTLLMKKPANLLMSPISSLDDLTKQYKIKYAPTQDSLAELYFRKMAGIEERLINILDAMETNQSVTQQNRTKLPIWDYPMPDKFTNLWRYMEETGMPNSTDEAIQRVLDSPSATEGFVWIGEETEVRYAEMTDCRLQQVGQPFGQNTYAVAVQHGSPLRDMISSAILNMLSRRELERLKDKWWNQNPNKKNC